MESYNTECLSFRFCETIENLIRFIHIFGCDEKKLKKYFEQYLNPYRIRFKKCFQKREAV